MTSERRERCVAMSRIVGLQWIGNVVLGLCVIAWLQIADSHVWQFVLSIVAAVLIAWMFVWLYSVTFRRVRLPELAAPVWMSAVVLLVVFGVWMVLGHPINAGREHEALYAGYWNSKLSPAMRTVFTYTRLVMLQDRFYDVVEFVIAGLLLPVAVEGMAAGVGSLRRVFSVYWRWRYWVSAAVAWAGATTIFGLLVGWTPGHTVRGEVVSAAVRIGVAYTVVVLLWCLVVTMVGRYLRGLDSD
jgi:hypothetical protein